MRSLQNILNYINKRPFLVLVLLLFTYILPAQYYSSGTDPSHIKWHKIETENFKLVFPDTFKQKGQYLAKVFEEIYKSGGASLKHHPRKISVLIHSETAYSNGFVSWAPKRIELYNNPNQNIYAQDWLQQLALHEFRHVVQLDKLNTGFTKILTYLLGEQAIGATLGLNIPLWFLEGDAVVAETALTASGRGRMPGFKQGMRAQIMDKNIYPYEKAMFGSYKDFVPNHYQMGYFMVAGARAKYGSDIWAQAVDKTGRKPWLLTSFNRGQKQISGVNKVGLYKKIFSDLKYKWKQQDSRTAKSKFTEITQLNKSYSNYLYPVALGDSGYIAELSGPGEINRFVFVANNGSHHTLFIPGSRNKEPFSYADGTICWAELEPDPRWENRMYSVIKCYHISTKKTSKITRKSRYFAPALSPDGKRIATVSVDNGNNYRLTILDRQTGSVLEEHEHGNNHYLFTPTWNDDGTQLACIVLTPKGKKIVVLKMHNNDNREQWEERTKETFTHVSLPKWGKADEIIFTAGYSGTEDIYSVKNGKITQLTQSAFGAMGATYHNEHMVYSNYTADGYQLVKASPEQWIDKPLSKVHDHSVKLHQEIAAQEIHKPDFNAIDSIADYKVTKYSKWNLINVHSWAPAFVNIDDQEFTPGLSLMSQNLLGTASTLLGYNGDSQKSREKYYFNFKYQGWYPVLQLEVKHGNDRIKYDPSNVYVSSTDTFSYSANQKRIQTRINLDVSLPFNITRGKYHTFLQPALKYGIMQRSGYSVGLTKYSMDNTNLVVSEKSTIAISDVNYQTLEYSLYFHRLLRRTQRDVAPRWGQVAEVLYQNTPLGNIDAGGIFGLHTRLYFPGLLKHHSVKIENNYQYKTIGDKLVDGDVIFYRKHGDYFDLPRAYENKPNDKMYSFKGDYIFPLCNPDLNLSGVFYLKRITTHLFYDYSKLNERLYNTKGDVFDFQKDYSSTGFEMRAEIHAFRFMFPFSIGYRYARMLESHQNNHEFLMGMNISGFSIGTQ
ncbi:hypothetical protein SAMN06265379_10462 [Saccharicrinis carchari]|uniref:WD40-like Beta Propeller Repeat n=1 Tax=Saccharicrinis carchari TaxID=1168039 RepID=A0A521CZ87_SACCC|nr:hypothetical protein [Saccharicrinis carchari]SMO64767.1 hypothetical protein SAMN06265379_10462 [Saccharicrinis carchari]